MPGLLNHCGAEPISLQKLRALPDPQPLTETHYPLRHDRFVDECIHQLGKYGWEISKDDNGDDRMEFSLINTFANDRWSKEMKHKDTMFGVICLKSKYSDYEPTIGLRNSNTMHSKARFALGNRVFVCDNMCFFGEEQFERKHTKNIYNELPQMVEDKIKTCRAQFEKDHMRIEHYKSTPLDGGQFTAFGNEYKLNDADDLLETILSRASGKGIMLNQGTDREKHVRIPGGDAFGPWRTNYYTGAGHVDFLRGDYWALLNAYTEVAKKHGAVGGLHQERTRAVTMILDEFSGFNNRLREVDLIEEATVA